MEFKRQTEDFPSSIYAYIEISQGSNVKYEYDEELQEIIVDRILSTSMVYPANYGFIPLTRGEDGDPLDVLVFSMTPIAPNKVIRVKPIGMAEMEDEEGIDNKIISVPYGKSDPAYSHLEDLDDIPTHIKDTVRHFFEHYKETEEGKFMKFLGYKNKNEALNIIRGAARKYIAEDLGFKNIL